MGKITLERVNKAKKELEELISSINLYHRLKIDPYNIDLCNKYKELGREDENQERKS